MSKLAYFLGGMIAGAAALGVVSWFVAGRDGDSCCSLGDDDGCLRDDAAPEAGGATVQEADSATSTEAGGAAVHEAGGAGMPEAAPAAEAATRQAEPAGSEAPQPA